MIRRPPRSTLSSSSAASDVYKRQVLVVFLVLVKHGFATVFREIKAGHWDSVVENSVMVVYSMQDRPWMNWIIANLVTRGGAGHSCDGCIFRQGMFSDLLGAVGALKYAEEHGAIGVQFSMQNPDYVDAEHGLNYWDYFFESSGIVTDPLLRAQRVLQFGDSAGDPSMVVMAPRVHFNGFVDRFGQFGSWTQVTLGRRSREVPFPLPNLECGEHCGMTHDDMARVVQTYMKFKPEFVAEVDQFWEAEVSAGDFVVGIHFRGTDKVLIWPFSVPDYTLFADEAERVARQAGKLERLRLFVATDELEAMTFFLNRFGPLKVSFQPGSPRLSSKDPAAIEGGTHKSLKFTAYDKAHFAMMDAALLGRCQYVVKNRSSLSDFSLLLHPRFKLNYSFILGNTVTTGTQLAQRAADLRRVRGSAHLCLLYTSPSPRDS
eukprot:TRINITY_DN16907_c0_g1_i1.p1 TRINITY_DN16907_c0_g1~~TRINITY_DN16907_c0_g1_i1.p1  ORF type:complete len:432 (+),score=100.00 TRINITY_DN16907_c0_g1_i1:118-1413(+)